MQAIQNLCSMKEPLCMCRGAGKQASRVYSAAQKEILEKCAEFVENVIIHRDFDDLDAFAQMFKEVSFETSVPTWQDVSFLESLGKGSDARGVAWLLNATSVLAHLIKSPF
jgi:hypothetical protein